MLKVLYAGSPDVAAKPLQDIVLSKKHCVVGVLTNPPSPQGRKKELVPTAVAQMTQKLNAENDAKIKLFEPEKIKDVADQIKELKPDILVCFAYGKIFSEFFLQFFPQGGINLHPSLLPLYRGCAPVPAAILNCDKETGITIQRIAKEMDSGNILLQKKILLNGTETAESLLNEVSEVGGDLFLQVLDKIDSNSVEEIEQDSSKATYFGMLKKEDGLINWADNVVSISAKIRAFYPWPGAFTNVGENQLIIHNVAVYKGNFDNNSVVPEVGAVIGIDKKEGILIQTGNGILAVKKLQWKTKKAMEWKDFINGSRNFVGSICGK